jgi:hypothetical protein
VNVTRNRAPVSCAANAVPLAETSRQAIPTTPRLSRRNAAPLLAQLGQLGKFRLVRFVEYC